MGMRHLKCEWCGNTYSSEREWCPHCLAPRSDARDVTHRLESEPEDVVFYADNLEYYRHPVRDRPVIPDTYGVTERA